MKLGLALPTMDLIHAGTAWSLAQLAVYNALYGLDLHIINPRSSIVQKGRQTAIEQAQGLGVDKVLFLDSDMLFPPHTAIKLLNANKAIVGCTYVQRREPHRPTSRHLGSREWVHAEKGGEVIEVEDIGTGVLMISMRVFEKMNRPYFDISWNAVNKSFVGEDVSFCRKARKLGYKIHCDLGLSAEIGHIGIKNHYFKEEEN